MNTIEENLSRIQKEVKENIPKTAHYQPNIIAVTKYFDENAIINAYKAGLRHFGESRVIEAVEKISKLPQEIRENSTFHLIGHLQSNKVKKAVAAFDIIQSTDSLKLAETISDEALKAGKVQKVLLQLNNANEEQKFGFTKDELTKNFERIIKLEGIEVLGLMNMAPFEASEQELRILFTEVRDIRDSLNTKYGCNLEEISMGMSQDYKIAVQCGSTMLRIGRKLFEK